MAVQCLRTNEADMAVCGGVNGIFTPESFLQHSFLGAQSPDGRSRSFSVDANSYAKDDGLDLLLLKQLSDAERGGDPIEANCLDRFFNRSNLDPPLLLGSLKSNLGHTEGAADVISLIKVAMYHNDDQAFLQRISQQLLLKRTISYPHSAIFVFLNRQQLQEQINAFLTEQASPGLSLISRPTKPLVQKICFVFSGQGPQWWAMGRHLYESEPLFNKWINVIDGEMTKINNDEWRLLEELIEKKNEEESRINDTNIAQSTLFAIQVVLAALLISWNIYPSSIISHSAGVQAAAFVAGRLTLEETVRILALSMSEDEVENKLLKGIEHLACIAVVNSPRSVTISGDGKTIDEIQTNSFNLKSECIQSTSSY
ncbi:unnamed protein product [Adineta steineri]|uniref:Uncharacterized protein n=1 Tax=Adineta steineri TaxID=433720 RepID=A0A819YEM8_9BILA|nr:unnamed protein product [Adineta steineri]